MENVLQIILQTIRKGEGGEAATDELTALVSAAESVEGATGGAQEGVEALGKSSRETSDDVGGLGDEVEGMGDKSDESGKKAKSFGMSLTDLKAGVDLASKAFEIAGRVLDATVMKAASWGDSMGDLAQLTGASVKETSAMAATFELMGVSTETLESALKSMTKNGVQLNLDSLKKLSKEYQAIQDPITQNEFLFKNFGKAGIEMAEIMGKDADELERLGAAAALSGKVIDEQAAAAAENFNIELAILKQKSEGAAIAIGNALIPTLSEAIEGGENWVKMWGAVNLLIQKNTGILTEEQAALRAAALAAGDVSAVYTEQFNPAITSTTDAVDRQNERVTALANTITTTAVPNVDALTASAERWKAMAAQAEAEAALKLRLDGLTGAASDLAFGMGELTTATLFNAAAEGLDADAAYNLAQQMGLIDPAAAAAKDILDDLRTELEKGQITTGQYVGQVALLDMAVRSLPDGKTITITYLEEYKAALRDEGDRSNDRQGGAIGDGYSMGTHGEWLTVPSGYPNDSYPIRLQSGEEFMVKTPRESVTPAPTGGDTIVLQLSRNDEDTIAAIVRRQLALAGESASNRRRT